MKRLLLIVTAAILLMSCIIGCSTITQTEVPGTIGINGLSVEPQQVQLGQAVTITIMVANTTDTQGTYDLILKINDEEFEDKTVTIAANQIKVVPYTANMPEAGNYTVTVDDFTATFSVVPAE